MQVRRTKYEEEILKTIGKLGLTTPYSVCKQISEGKNLLGTYPSVLKAIKRLTKSQYLLAIVGKDTKGREVKKYGLCFKGFVRILPTWEDAKEIIEQNWKTLTHPKPLKYEIKFLGEKKEKKIISLQTEVKFILHCLLASEREEYDVIKAKMESCNLQQKNYEVVNQVFYNLLTSLPFLPESLLKKIKESNEKLIVEILKRCIDNLATDLMRYYDYEIKTRATSIKSLVEKLNLKEKNIWFDALHFLTELVPAITYIRSKNYDSIPKLIIGKYKNGKIRYIESD
jgi:hypothetical protein